MSAEQLLKLSTGDPASQHQMLTEAVATFQTGNLDGARTQLTAACRDHIQLPPARVLMAYLLVSNSAVAAANELESVVVELPADPEAYAMLADLAYQDGRRAEAELLFARGLRLAEAHKDNPERKARLLGRARRRAGCGGRGPVAVAAGAGTPDGLVEKRARQRACSSAVGNCLVPLGKGQTGVPGATGRSKV